MLYYQTVSPGLTSLLKQLSSMVELDSFVLVGGTSLSLQIGHRKSVDIDLFTGKHFDIAQLQNLLYKKFEGFVVNWQNKNGFTCLIEGIKVDFFNWHTSFIYPIVEVDGFRLANKLEIGAMKFECITGRKEKKDFIDIAFLLQEFSLKQLVDAFRSRYPFLSHTLVLECLMAVDLADESLAPDMLIDMDWQTVKNTIVENVTAFFEEQKNAVALAKEERIRRAEELLKNKKA